MKLIDGYKYKGTFGRQIELFKFRKVTLLELSIEKWTTSDIHVMLQLGGGSLLNASGSIGYYALAVTILGKTYVY